jgi:Ni/Co efflux regulator RcnB
MKKISYVLAALATIAIAAPSIASAEDKMMDKGDMGMHKTTHHKMMHHKMMHHKKMMMKKDGM